MEKTMHKQLLDKGYESKVNLGYEKGSKQAALNLSLLVGEITDSLEQKTNMVLVAGELVPENFPEGMNLENRYVIYKKR